MESTASTTVSSIGANMYSDAAATHEIAQGAVVPNGQQIWLKSTGPSAAELDATAVATVPSGNVYLYTGGATLAQKLILAQIGHPGVDRHRHWRFPRARVTGGAKSDHWTASRAPGRRDDPHRLR